MKWHTGTGVWIRKPAYQTIDIQTNVAAFRLPFDIADNTLSPQLITADKTPGIPPIYLPHIPGLSFPEDKPTGNDQEPASGNRRRES